MENRKTSERLERALARYDLEALPDETKKMLEETMGRSDFDPDKLAEAIEREEERRGMKKESGKGEERCPWYVALTRFLAFLLFVGGMFGFFCVTLQLAVRLFDTLSGFDLSGDIAALQQNCPAAFYTLLAVCAGVFFFWVPARFVKTMVGEE